MNLTGLRGHDRSTDEQQADPDSEGNVRDERASHVRCSNGVVDELRPERDHGQLHERLRNDDRVRVLERTNVRSLAPADVGGPVDLVVHEGAIENSGSMLLVLPGPVRVVDGLVSNLGFGSTFLAVLLGTLTAYAFSRFKVPLKDDLLFFILSTRMMPPIAVAIPIYLMYRAVGLSDTLIGMILLYTAVNV